MRVTLDELLTNAVRHIVKIKHAALLLHKGGSWYSMGETRIGQGRDSAKQYLRDNPEIAAKLEADIRRDFHKLMSSQSKIAARAAGRAVDVSADDFEG